MERRDVVRRAWRELEPELQLLGVELVEVDYVRQGASDLLRLYIDKPGGVNIDDCAEVSRHVSLLLDKLDFLGSDYLLEVSSPGIDRPIRKPSDFEAYVGEPIRLQSEVPVDGRKRFRGNLAGYAEGLIRVEVDGTEYRIHIENLKKAQLDR
jgi:ribosome maturation factor RimP